MAKKLRVVGGSFVFASAGVLDEATVEHNGSDFLFNNDTGKTKFGDKSNYQFVIDHANTRIGIGTETPNYSVHIKRTGANVTLYAERVGDAKCYINATATYGNFGTASNHPLRLVVNNVHRATIEATGILDVPAVYAHDMNGETIRDLQINDSGELGYDSSTVRIKEDIKVTEDVSWLYQLRVIDYKVKGKVNGIRHIGLIAEEVKNIKDELVYYDTYQVDGEKLNPIYPGEVANWLEFRRISEKNEIIKKIAKIRRTGDELTEEEKEEEREQGTIFTKDEEIEVKKVPDGVQYKDLISPMLLAIQQQKKKIDDLKVEVQALKG